MGMVEDDLVPNAGKSYKEVCNEQFKKQRQDNLQVEIGVIKERIRQLKLMGNSKFPTSVFKELKYLKRWKKELKKELETDANLL